jgi:alpha-L-rhamnosidase
MNPNPTATSQAIILNGPDRPASVKMAGLRCEMLPHPMGVDTPTPRLSWKLTDTRRGARQTAYRVLVASSSELLGRDQGDLWDSGTIESDQSHLVEYAGKPLVSGQHCYWKIRAWDLAGKEVAWSEPSWWEMGLLSPSDWQAKWIQGAMETVSSELTDEWIEFAMVKSSSDTPEVLAGAKYFGRQYAASVVMGCDFTLDTIPTTARMYASARGFYTVYLNGERVGDAEYEPTRVSPGDATSYYAADDITTLLRKGENRLRCVLRTGRHETKPAFLLQINAEIGGKSRVLVASDAAWRQTTCRIVNGDYWLGEVYDARISNALVHADPVSTSAWKSTVQELSTTLNVRWRFLQPERVIRRVAPVAVFSPAPGVYTFDLGEMITGAVEWKVPGYLPAGARIVFRYSPEIRTFGPYGHNSGHKPGAELHYPDESRVEDKSRLLAHYDILVAHGANIPVWIASALRWTRYDDLSTTSQNMVINKTGVNKKFAPCDLYVAGDQSGETWCPTVRCNAFRYVEVVGLTQEPRIDDLTGLMIHTDSPRIGDFQSSEDDFNRCYAMCVKTVLMNQHGIMHDCMDRERTPWNGAWPKVQFMRYAYDIDPLIRKHTSDNVDNVRRYGRAGTACDQFHGITAVRSGSRGS